MSRFRANANLAVAYVRVSTGKQALGEDAQRAAIERYASQRGIVVADWFTDQVSGSIAPERRPGLGAALVAMRSHRAGILLVHKRDRIGRDSLAVGLLERVLDRRGAHIVTADGSAQGQGAESVLLRGVMDVVSEYERQLIRARTRAALAVKRQRGEKTGGQVPFGFVLGSDGRHLVPRHDEQAVLATIARLRSEGVTLAEICARLNADRVRPSGVAIRILPANRADAGAADPMPKPGPWPASAVWTR